MLHGYPAVVRCDNGPELACEAMAEWAGERVGLSFIPPGEPWRNGYVESLNGLVRDECLNINIFWSLARARVVISDWKDDYNHRRRHSSPGYQPQPSTVRAAPTAEELSQRVDQFSGSRHYDLLLCRLLAPASDRSEGLARGEGWCRSR